MVVVVIEFISIRIINDEIRILIRKRVSIKIRINIRMRNRTGVLNSNPKVPI